MKAKTTTRTYSKALARSGPEMRPEQILLNENDQSLTTQSDLNAALYNGGGGGGGGGTIDPNQLNDLATKKELENEATARDTGDKANLGLINKNKSDIASINNDYTTTDEFNTLNGRVSTNKSDISSLQEGFDAAVLAAQDGAGSIEIELQSTAKKADIYTKTETDSTFAKKSDIPADQDLSAYAKKADIPTDNRLLFNGAKYITLAEVPEIPEGGESLTYQIQTDQVLRSGEPAIELVDSESNFSNVKFAGSDGIAVSSDMASIKISSKPLQDEVGAMTLTVAEFAFSEPFTKTDPEFTEPDLEKEAKAEAGDVETTPIIGLVNGENIQGSAWFQGGGGTGVSRQGNTIRITTNALEAKIQELEERIAALGG